MAEGRTRGPSPEKTARTRAAIVGAAMGEFLEHGFAAATMSGVAQRAGLAKGTLYRYFDTKEALFAGLVRDVATSPLREVERLPLLPGERVGAYLRRTLLPAVRIIEAAGRADVARLVLAEGRRFPALVEIYRREVYQAFIGHIRDVAELAFRRGEIGDDALVRFPYLLAGPLWIGMVHNGVIDPDHPIDIGAMFGAQLDLLFGR